MTAASLTSPPNNLPRQMNLILFRCGRQQCAMQLEHVQEIIAIPALSTPLGTPTVLDGFLNLEHTAVPVIRLALLFGDEPDALSLHTPLIITRAGSGLVALRVTAVLRLTTIDGDVMRPFLAERITCGSVMIDDHVTAILSPEHLVHAREQAAIDELRAIENERLATLEAAA